MSKKEWQALKKLILTKNPDLNNKSLNDMEGIESDPSCINQNHRGRAHITRDLCYLIFNNPNILEDDLKQHLIQEVGENDDYWNAYYQNCQKENCVGYNIESARSLGLIECDELRLTAKGMKLVNAVDKNEIFTHYYEIGTKRFFYNLALEDEVIKTAMDIVKEKKKLRFWSPTCDRTNLVIEKYHQNNQKFICEEKKHPECVDCDHDVLNHIEQSSLVLETLKKTAKHSGFVFWFTSRVTPMHLTGHDPAYTGQSIYWDKHGAALIEGMTKQNYGDPWVFSVNKDNFSKLINDNIVWSSALEVKKDDLILFYRGEPESAITDIFIAKTDPYDATEDKGANNKVIALYRLAKIIDPPSWETLKNNPIFKEWAGIQMNFGQHHFKTSKKVWDELKRLILEKNPELEELLVNGNPKVSFPKAFQIIKKLFHEFKTTYLPTPEGIEHTPKYDLERQKVEKYFKIINNDENAIQDVNDPPINHLLPIKQPAVAPVAVGDIKAYGYKNGDLPGLTIAVKKLIDELDYNRSRETLKDLITNFKNSRYKKGFQTAMFTPTLYYLKPDFWFINKKTVATYNLFSELIGDNKTISGNLIEYIDNNNKIHELVHKLKKYIPELDFEKFDAFCHWMSSESLGNYANDKIKFHKWLVKNEFEYKEINQPDEYGSFNEFLAEKNFLYTPETVENFLLSLKVKPFVILTGNSGTGKTKIAQLFAEYLETKDKGNYQIIPVGANWTENHHLLGFYNVIIQNYQTTRSLELLLSAVDDEDNPYLMILDEMNLSHVERYFADFLSAMESGEKIPLHSNNNGENELVIPEDLEIPPNVFVVGTVNVDETTYMFSPKVLDRANTIEFSTYPAKSYILGEFKDNNLKGNVEYLENPLSDPDIRKTKIDDLKDDLKNVQIPEGTDLWTFLADEIQQFQETLSEAGFDFGFRVVDEILRFMYVAWVYEKPSTEWTNWQRYFDAQIMQKMLPKIHGSQRELDIVLENLFKLCYNNESDKDTWYLQELYDEYSIYPTSAKKLQWMGKILQEKRFVSFTN
ncbi:AAA family ATPase [Methanobacterium ferruginis]|uniref:AAA family ATPase n=1 Tax=Methanobacterium ferruginis TaxID=710191 RepID=UPI002572E8CB|nr:AAA family ATPase [Methanobacterium ferruginis]BDZ68775.1 hypothetical protein GCM10025860_22230 [Methanobacterium ferruginis]